MNIEDRWKKADGSPVDHIKEGLRMLRAKGNPQTPVVMIGPKIRQDGECCLNCGMIDQDEGPFCDNVYGQIEKGTSEISETFWCQNYVPKGGLR